MFQQKVQHPGIKTADMKHSDATVRNGHIKPQSKYDSEKQMSDHPRDLIISGMTTCGSHKAEETATQHFGDQRGSGKELEHLGAPATIYSIIFSMSTFMINTNVLWCYIITSFALLNCKQREKGCFLTAPPAYKCYTLI